VFEYFAHNIFVNGESMLQLAAFIGYVTLM